MKIWLKNGGAIFFQIKDLNTWDYLSKKYFFCQQPTEMKMKAVEVRNNSVQHEWRQKLQKLKKGRSKGTEYFINCALAFLFFSSLNQGSFELNKMIPQKWFKNSGWTNNLLHKI